MSSTALAPHHLLRNPLPFPKAALFPRGLIAHVERLEYRSAEAAAAANAARFEAIGDGSEFARWTAFAADLQHPLSQQLVDSRGGDALRDLRCAIAERDTYQCHRMPLIAALRGDDPSALQQAARAFCAAATGSADIDCRRAAVGLEPGPDGNRVEFGNWQDVPARLAELQHDVRHSPLPAAMNAVAVLAVMLNIHAFPDGNGRCARALFNAALEAAGRPMTAYVPLRLVFDVSLGGFELRLRDAETHGNWAPLVQYFATVFTAQRLLAVAARNTVADIPTVRDPAAAIGAAYQDSP
jgi:hypothetical protein